MRAATAQPTPTRSRCTQIAVYNAQHESLTQEWADAFAGPRRGSRSKCAPAAAGQQHGHEGHESGRDLSLLLVRRSAHVALHYFKTRIRERSPGPRMAVLKSSTKQNAAQQFLKFVTGKSGQGVL
ncbi:Ferric iron ABC transporter, iron-binding protein (plasmid) [Rhodococcus sp. WAY2]|nr:Ferric iron ABC transporter, iron-binding protein [Rhodococcus sp. WAY2]